MRAALVSAFLIPSPALADGPALAHLTLAGTTITLTEVAPIDPSSQMTFAQMHLGFPLPPILHVTLQDDGSGVVDLHLNEGVEEDAIFFEAGTIIVTGTTDQFTIEATALTRRPLGQFTTLPVRIEIQLTSP